MERNLDSSSPSLLCHEDHQSYVNEETHDLDEYDEDYVKILVNKESNFHANTSSSSPSFDNPSWLRNFRLEAVQWILNTRTLLSFRNRTAYLAVSYLDRFLSVRSIDEDKTWAIRLLSVACLSLAAKMEESQVPALSQYPVSEFGFDFRVIEKMELLVLSTFSWNLSLVSPFAYLPFLIKKLVDQNVSLNELMSKSIELLMAVTQEIILIDYRPSVIAAAAVLAASDWQLTKETLLLKLSSVSLWEILDKEQFQMQLYSCYSIMQRLCSKSNPSTTPNVTLVDQTLVASSSEVGAKRSLTFDDCDQPDQDQIPEKIQRRE